MLLEGPGLALRGLFIIDPNGVIKHLSVNDLPVGRSVEETLRLEKAFQFVEAHGEVCPANWTPESPTVGFFPNSNGSPAKRVPGPHCLKGCWPGISELEQGWRWCANA